MKIREQLKQYRSKNISQLYSELQKLYKQMAEFRFSVRFRKLKDISKIRKCKKKIARISTIMREKVAEQQK